MAWQRVPSLKKGVPAWEKKERRGSGCRLSLAARRFRWRRMLANAKLVAGRSEDVLGVEHLRGTMRYSRLIVN
jgi:hypothetical protein